MSESRDDLDRALTVEYDEIDKLKAQLFERDVLLVTWTRYFDDTRNKVIRFMINRTRTVLSASAEPTNKDDTP